MMPSAHKGGKAGLRVFWAWVMCALANPVTKPGSVKLSGGVTKAPGYVQRPMT